MEKQNRELYLLEQFTFNQKEDLQVAKKKTLTLLDNILPRHIVKQLIAEPNQTIAQNYSFVTVLSADIVGFTTFSETISPVQLVGYLNLIFSEFDQLAIRYNIEKIRTIGDACMLVA
jgi:adenylate cyclase